MRAFSRRAFLATSSLTLAGLSVGLARPGVALPRRGRQPVFTYGPEFIAPDTLRSLAVGGIDAARSAGAAYADIRISDLHTLDIMQGDIPLPLSILEFEFGYGIRVQVDGAWAFAFGTDLTSDAIARSARSAVDTARGLAKVAPQRRELAPAPVVTGEWNTPVEIDPFGVSPDEHAKLVGAYWAAGKRMLNGELGQCRIRWDVETRVFASSEGSLVTQRLTRVDPTVFVDYLQDLGGHTSLPIPGLTPRSAGFEYLLGANHQEQIKATLEETARWARMPIGRAELGRLPAVFDGTALGNILGGTLAQALMLSRALGHEADGTGTSFLAPVTETLGQPLFSPLLNVTADRAVPHFGAAKWDDEGVATEAYPVIQKGRVVDFFSTRATAPALAEWYAKRGVPLKSHGAAVSWRSQLAPMGTPSNLSVGTGSGNMSLDDLIKQLSNGIVARGVHLWGLGWGGVTSDPQLSGGIFQPMMMYEVKKGQIVRRLKHGYLQFSTKKFWNGITALGDASTVELFVRSVRPESTGISTTLPITAPAAHVQEIDVVSPRRRG